MRTEMPKPRRGTWHWSSCRTTKARAPKSREVFEDIRKTRNTDYVNNIWRALAVHPPMLKRFWGYMKEVMVKEAGSTP